MKILAYTAQDKITVLKRMASTLDPDVAKRKEKPFAPEKNNLCHKRTVEKIRTRQNKTDIIWLYGDGEVTYHSVLTDKDENVLVGAQYTLTGGNKFLGNKGFDIPEFGVLDFMYKMQVGLWSEVYFKDDPFEKTK